MIIFDNENLCLMVALLYFVLSSQAMVKKRTSNWSIDLILKERKMKKSLFMKVLALLFVGAGALAYSCSGDDIFEEEEDARSLAKRAMQIRGEETGPNPNAVTAIKEGSYSGITSNGRSCSVSVSWTRGYITRYSPESRLTGSASCNKVNARDIKVYPSWVGYYGIHGTISYTYDKIEKYTDEDGREQMRFVPTRGSDSFDCSPTVTFIDDDEV